MNLRSRCLRLRGHARKLSACAAVACMLAASVAEAQGGRRGPSPQQMKKMREQMEYEQREMARVQAEMAAKNREMMAKFDENGDGRLFGPEQAKYEAHLRDIRFGRAPNPYADIKPAGQGPRQPAKSGKK